MLSRADCAQHLGSLDLPCVFQHVEIIPHLKCYLQFGVFINFHYFQAMFVLQVPVELPFGTIHKVANKTLQTTCKQRQENSSVYSK